MGGKFLPKMGAYFLTDFQASPENLKALLNADPEAGTFLFFSEPNKMIFIF